MAGVDWAFIEQVLLVLLGFGLAFGAQGIQQWWTVRGKTKNLAKLLSLEIRLNKDTADATIKKFKVVLSESKSWTQNSVHPQPIVPAPSYRTIFDNSVMDFTLFDPKLSSKVVVLYGLLGYADADRDRCTEVSNAMTEIVDEVKPPVDQSTFSKLKQKQNLMLGYMEHYVADLELVSGESQKVLDELKKVATLEFPATARVAPPDITTDAITLAAGSVIP